MISLALLAAVTLDAAAIARTSATLNALGPHAFGSPRNRAAAQFVGAKFQDVGLAQTTVEDFVFEGASGTNVMATLPGRSDRLLIIATHHDTKKDAQDISGRSRTLSLLIEMGRQASRLRPAKTWILASFDGGESRGEGLAHYLETLGKTRDVVDGVIVLDASPLQDSTDPVLIAPSCSNGAAFERRAMASRDLVEAALGRMPPSLDVTFDDPGIGLLTQPFIRAFKAPCDPMAARALGNQLGVLLVKDASYSRGFLSRSAATTPADPALRDDGAVRLGEVAFAAIQGVDAWVPGSPQSDSWLVIGRTVLPGWLIFVLGIATLVPGLLALRAQATKLALRVAYSVVFTMVLYQEPEIALFAFALPNLLPPSFPRKYLSVAFIPFLVFAAAGTLCLVRGQVTGSWLSVWLWASILGGIAMLYLSPAPGRKAQARSRRGKR